VPEVKRSAKVVLVALAGATAGVVLARLRRQAEAPAPLPDERTQELRRKLAEARAAAADQEDFEAAGMGAETIVDEPPRVEPAEPEQTAPEPSEPEQQVAEPPEPEQAAAEPVPAPEAEAAAEQEPATEPEPRQPEAGREGEESPPARKETKPAPAGESQLPPQDEFEAMRRRIHEEGKAAADEMRRSTDRPEKP
jgi:hypothetical protein